MSKLGKLKIQEEFDNFIDYQTRQFDTNNGYLKELVQAEKSGEKALANKFEEILSKQDLLSFVRKEMIKLYNQNKDLLNQFGKQLNSISIVRGFKQKKFEEEMILLLDYADVKKFISNNKLFLNKTQIETLQEEFAG